MEDLFAPHVVEVAPKIIFVCTANICRSAYAERALARRLDGAARFGLTVESAGTHARSERAVDGTTAQVMRMRSLNTDHFARELRSTIADPAGLYLAMTSEHLAFIVQQYPKLTHHAFTLAEFAALAHHGRGAQSFSEAVSKIGAARWSFRHAPDDDVDDPYGKPVDVHERMVDQVDQMIEKVLIALT